MSAICLGALAVVWQRITLAELMLLFFGYAFFDGLVSIAGAFRAVQERERGGLLLLVEGIVGIGTALVSVAWSGLTALDDIYLIAVWAGVTGAIELAAALNLRRVIRGELLLASSGLASLALGALLAILPLTSPTATARWIGAYALLFGILLIALGVRLRHLVRLPAVAAI